MSAMRRLAFSTFAHIAADVHRSHASPATEVAKRLATSERVERKRQQQQHLTGIRLSGNYEPSDSLIDLFVNMHDQNRAKWLPWA
eukprot:6457860-Amphidinium_carterae.1